MPHSETASSGYDSLDHDETDQAAIDTIRTLAMDAVERANSGHPGTPVALAPVGYTLWRDFLRYDPATPDWPNRDRFVLSVGHASLLLYGLLHLAGVVEVDADGTTTGKPAVGLGDIQNFRQLDSKTPGHPEYRITTGVETTTGPLGQGCANSVGMALAERALAARFNRPSFDLFAHDVYVMCGDGDMMEGISSEAASTAGHLKLSNLCWIYDSNRISIEGSTELAFTEDVGKRFEAYGWNVLHVDDANDVQAVANALNAFLCTEDRPTLIIVSSVIGWGSPRAGSEKAHGEPFGSENVRATKRFLHWPGGSQFLVPDHVRERLAQVMDARGGAMRRTWTALFERYRGTYPSEAAEFERLRRGELPEDWTAAIPSFEPDTKGLSSRESGGLVLNAIASHAPVLMGGAADVTPSTKTGLTFAGAGSFQPTSFGGRNVHFGVREHAMGAIANGMALSYLRPYTAAFLVFSDYMRTPIRLAAIMELPTVFVFTHDSIGVGEDGPTHQPVEHLAALRAIPGLNVLRPSDANEVAQAWKVALSASREPSVLVLSRQALPTINRSRYASAEGLRRGGYILADSDAGPPDLILMATGSEVSLAVEAYEILVAEGIRARVVSMPSWHLFEKQDPFYRESVLPRAVRARIAVEQAAALGWAQYVGIDGRSITMSTFGASAPLSKLQARYGFTVENIVTVAQDLLRTNRV